MNVGVGGPLAFLLARLLVSACTVSPEPSPGPAPSSPSAAAPTPRASVAPTPEPGSDASARTGPRRAVVRVGTVTDTRSRQATGTGPAELRFTRKGDFGVVARIDCSRCRGTVSLTAPDRNVPWGTAPAPTSVAYLVDALQGTDAQQSLLLDTQGRWKVTVLSWNRLPSRTGTQRGRGSTVLALAESGGAVSVTYRPRGRNDQFGVRVFSESGDTRLFGESEPKGFTDTYDVDLPAVIAVQTNGSWTIEPR